MWRSAPLCSGHRKILTRRSDTLLHEHKSHAEFSLRVVWLVGIVWGSWVLGADVRRELLIALPFVVPLHLLNGFADGRPYRVEHPGAFRASPSLKILSFDPYQFAAHRLHGTPRDLARLCFLERRCSTGLRRHSHDKGNFHYPMRGSAQITTLKAPTKTEVNA